MRYLTSKSPDKQNHVTSGNHEKKTPQGSVQQRYSETFVLELAERIVQVAQKKGADQSECFIQHDWGVGVGIEKKDIKQISQITSAGFGIRVIKDGRLGFAYATSTDKIHETIEKALRISRISPEKIQKFPHRDRYTNPRGLFDKRVEELSISEFLDMMDEMVGAALEVNENIRVTDGGGGYSRGYCGVANSEGVQFEEKGTRLLAHLSCIVDKGNGASGSAYVESNNMDLNGLDIGKTAARRTMDLCGARDAAGGVMEAIFINEASWELFENTVIPAFDGPDTLEGQTYLHEMGGEKIAPNHFNLYNDPHLRDGLCSFGADDEGVRAIKLPLLENGEVKNFLFDNFSAQKYGVSPTSSGIRAQNFRSIPKTCGSNITMEFNRNRTLEGMIEEMDRGVIIHNLLGAHTSNRNSGDFSVNSSKLFLVKNGEILHPIKSAMISGNALETLENINCLGKDRKMMSGGMTNAGAYLPSVKIDNVTVTGTQ